MTVTLGVDPHKASHTVVATDQVGRQLDQTTSRGTRTSDHQELIGWVAVACAMLVLAVSSGWLGSDGTRPGRADSTVIGLATGS